MILKFGFRIATRMFVVLVAGSPASAADLPTTQPVMPATTQVVIPTDNPCVKVITYKAPGQDTENASHAVVIVPRAYLSETREGTSARRWPVVYALHGYGVRYTRYWEMFSQADKPLDALVDRFGIILVMPDGNRTSWYLNAAPDLSESSNWQYETLITEVLIPEVDHRYRTWAEPAGRGVTGISMGGHGAIYLAARHPELFGACTSLSGILNLTDTTNPQDLARRLGSFEQNRARWVEHSALTQAEKFVGRSTAILFDCGWDDPFISSNRAMHLKLMMLNVLHDYIERPGVHKPPYWVNAMPYHLQFLADHLRPAGLADAQQ